MILGHTISGLYAGPSRAIANSAEPHKLDKMNRLVSEFVEMMNRIGGFHANGLVANAFELIPGANPAFLEVEWPEGAWQVELFWQFLLHADRAGVNLGDFDVRVGDTQTYLDSLLLRGLTFHDQKLFNGSTYVTENGQPLTGRCYAAPINHAADTLRDLAANLTET